MKALTGGIEPNVMAAFADVNMYNVKMPRHMAAST
jgi:hypothetical protein